MLRLKPLHIRPTKDNTSDGARFWHLDNIRDDYLKLFINLMDIENNHGPFAAISAAESKKIIKENKSDNRYDLKDQEFGSKVIKATGSIGTSTFVRPLDVCIEEVFKLQDIIEICSRYILYLKNQFLEFF